MIASELFDFPSSLPFREIFDENIAPWEWVGLIKTVFATLPTAPQVLNCPAGFEISGDVWIHESVKIPAFGSIKGPVYIAEGCELRPGVYIRGNVIAGANCVLGNSCEFKNCLLLDGVQVPHFSYVGDSVLGNRAHLGAGVICSNLRLDQKPVIVRDFSGSLHQTNVRKLGSLIADSAEIGCNAVLNPGSILGRRALVMPSMAFRGTLAASKIAMVQGKIGMINRPD